MLGRCLMLSPLLLVLAPRYQETAVLPEASPTPLWTSEWIQQIEREIERAECCWSNTADGAYSAPNPSHNLRSRIGAGGLEVSPRGSREYGAGDAWKLLLRTRSFGSADDVRPLGEPRLTSDENRIDLQYAALCEWFVNDERGLEQGWTIPSRPPGSAGSALRIEIEACGLRAEIAEDGRSAVLVDDAARTRLRYEHLRAWDATGRDLSACLLPATAGFAIHVEQAGAHYPLTVDPILSGPEWTAEGNEGQAQFGWSVSGAGDVNGDGFDDVIVGAPQSDDVEAHEGRAFVYLGSADGLSLVPDWTGDSDSSYASFGISVSGAGDVNADGFDDVIVGAFVFSNGQASEGAAYLYMGSSSGLSLVPDWMAESNQAGALFGSRVSGAGDVDGDGFDDVIVGAPDFDHGPGQANEGRAFLYLGSAGGPSLAPDWTAESDLNGAFFGTSVSDAGDVNGDGFDDVIVGAPRVGNGQENEGRAYLYLGSASGLALVPDWTAESDQAGALFGQSTSGTGDVNGDGFDDVIIGAPWFGNGQLHEGRAFLYFGSANGPSLSADWTEESNLQGTYFARSVSGAGDVNNDGFDDVMIGTDLYHHGESAEGGAFVYLGSAVGPGPDPAWMDESDLVFTLFGCSVSGAGDVNGDGFDDVIVGASNYTDGEAGEGRAYAYFGCGPLGTKYCIATTNSTGAPADLSAWCSASAADGNLTLEAAPVPDQFGIFFHGANQAQNPFGNGFLCTTGGIVRGAVIQASGNLANTTYDNSDAQHSLFAFVNTTRNFQYWFRDPMGGGAFFNTSNAVSIAILP